MRFFIALFFAYSALAQKMDWDRVYLASFPRSGNHWVRILIEEATHIATGSAYRDTEYTYIALLQPWGAYALERGYSQQCRLPAKGEPVVVKTHYPSIVTPYSAFEWVYRAAICLVRHPIDAIYSYHVYKTTRDEMMSEEQLRKYIKQWRAFFSFWERRRNVLFIRYEQMYQYPVETLGQMIQYIGYQAEPEDVDRAVAMHPPMGGLLKHLDRYTKQQIEIVRLELGDLLDKYGYAL